MHSTYIAAGGVVLLAPVALRRQTNRWMSSKSSLVSTFLTSIDKSYIFNENKEYYINSEVNKLKGKIMFWWKISN